MFNYDNEWFTMIDTIGLFDSATLTEKKYEQILIKLSK